MELHGMELSTPELNSFEAKFRGAFIEKPKMTKEYLVVNNMAKKADYGIEDSGVTKSKKSFKPFEDNLRDALALRKREIRSFEDNVRGAFGKKKDKVKSFEDNLRGAFTPCPLNKNLFQS